mgnify:FL=1
MVSAELVEELRMIIKEDYQLDLEPQEASDVANTLVSFFELLAKIDSESEGENNNEEEHQNG